MVLSHYGSRTSLVNLLSDFILSKIPLDETSCIEVADCINFYIIKGKTTSKEVLPLSEIISEFKEKYSNILSSETTLGRTIDVIEYGVKLDKKTNLKYSFFNTEYCEYNFSQIDNFQKDKTKSYNEDYLGSQFEDRFIITSNFPHGHSLDYGRKLYYFGKHIVYNIPPQSPFTKLTLFLDEESENFKVYDDFYKEYDNKLKSAILDCINWDATWITTEMKKVDWSSEITNPLSEFEFLKKKVKDFVII